MGVLGDNVEGIAKELGGYGADLGIFFADAAAEVFDFGEIVFIRLSVQPRLSANLMSLTPSKIWRAVSALSTAKEIMPPKPVVCALLIS